MFRKMRRSNQALSAAENAEILRRGTSGVLAVSGDDGYPYAVPLSYACGGGRIYFHCARAGHKLDAIRHSEKVSFCVVDRDQVLPREYTTDYRSVIVFGKARIVENEAEKRRALGRLVEKLAPDDRSGGLDEIERALDRVCVIELTIDHITGKRAKVAAAAQ